MQMPIFSGCAIITTYRCNAHCQMCSRWQHQSKANDEFKPELLLKLPKIHFINITGGEPFLRNDIETIVEIAHQKANRVVISTNGIMSERIVSLMRKYPKTGLRISLEGLQETNDKIRGINNGYDNAMALLKRLKRLGCKDIGVSITVNDDNYKEVIPLYEICKKNGYEFASGTIHSSYFFETEGEIKFKHPKEICDVLEELANRMKKDGSIKSKYRAIFNEELINHINHKPIAFPCKCASHFFVIDPYGEVFACVGSQKPMVMGDLNKKSFEKIWFSERANEIRDQVSVCNRNCCMSGNVAGEMKRNALLLTSRIKL